MIRSDADYRDAVARIEAEKQGIADRESFLKGQGFGPEEVERGLSALRAMHQGLVDDVAEYVQIRQRNLTSFDHLACIGRLLVAARLASGLTSRELASKLGTSESQVADDEHNEYNSVTVDRACRILDALGVEVRLQCQMMVSKGFDTPSALPPRRRRGLWKKIKNFFGAISDREPPIRTAADLMRSDLVGSWADRADLADGYGFARQLRWQAEFRLRKDDHPKFQ